jgi:hypothetical protein
MAITLDFSNGKISTTTNIGSVASNAVTTAQANEVLVAIIGTQSNVTGNTTSSVSGGGLTWTKQGSAASAALVNAGNGNSAEDISVFTAIASSVITSQVITATFNNSSVQAATIVIQAYKGVDTVTPLDTHAGNPFSANNNTTTNSLPTVTAVSTTNANTVIIGAYCSQNFGAITQTAGTSYTLDYNTNNPNTAQNELTCVEHQIFSSAQSSVSVAFGTNDSDWHMVAIALQVASGGDVLASGSWGA